MGTKRSSAVLMVIATCHGAAAPAQAAPGELDAGFGDNGFVRLSFEGADAPDRGGERPDGAGDRPVGVSAQSDGKLLIGVGTSLEDFAVLRLTGSGMPDPDFGANGRASVELPGFRGDAFTVIQLLDGNILAAGTATADGGGSDDLALARFIADGRIDTSFGTSGVSQAGYYAVDRPAAVVQQADGKLVIAGTLADADPCFGCWDYKSTQLAKPALRGTGIGMVLVRFDTVGARDPGFGDNSEIVIRPLGGGGFRALAEQPDGRLVAAGFSGAAIAAVRFEANGGRDETFGNDGLTMVPGPAGTAAFAEAVVVQSDGRIVVAGTRYRCDPDDPDCALADVVIARLHVDGSLDTSFGSGGIAGLDVRGWGRTELSTGGLVIEPDGAIVVAGRTIEPDGATYFFVARLTPGGTLDPSFGERGVTLIDVGLAWQADDWVAGLARYDDGSIAIAMSTFYWDTDWFSYAGYFTGLTIARLAPAGGHPGIVGLARSSVIAAEGSEAKFIVRRTGGSAGTVSVNYATGLGDCDWCADSTDFVGAAGTLTWTDGDTEDRTVTIPISADAVADDRETFGFQLDGATGGAVLAAQAAGVSIIDAALANPGTLQMADARILEAQVRATLRVSRTGGRAGAVSVDYATIEGTATAGTDFTAVGGTLRWRDGDDEPKEIVIALSFDGVAEGEESFRVMLSNPGGGATLGTPAATITLLDSSVPPSVNPGGGGGSAVIEPLLLALLWLMARRRRAARQSRTNCTPMPSSRGRPIVAKS